MRWQQIGNTDGIACTEVNEEELATVTQCYQAFLSSSRGKRVSKELKNVLAGFVGNLRPGDNNFSLFRFSAYSRLLRWCISGGRQCQDDRRDTARPLWRSLFRGPFPTFYQWHESSREYVTNYNELREWIQSQVG